MSTRVLNRFLWIPMAALAVACGARDDGVREPPNGEEFRDGVSGAVVVQIQNQNTRQATVYMIEDRGMRNRLGDVPSLSERFFTRDMVGTRTVEFDVRLLAGRTFRTPSVVARPGDTIQVTIPSR